MPDYLTPGVYVEEVPSSRAPIDGVGTAVGAFVGLAPAGPVNEPQRIASWKDFARTFGGPEQVPFMDGAYLAHSVYGFFENGGRLCWVVRVGPIETDSPARALLGAGNGNGTGGGTLRAASTAGGPVTVDVREEPDGGADGERKTDGKASYTLEIKDAGGQTERLDGLKLATLVKDVNARSSLVRLEAEGAVKALEPGTYQLERPTAATVTVDADALIGDTARREGLGSLAAIDEVTMVCVPDAVNLVDGDAGALRAVHEAMLSHCERAGDRMAIIDPPPTARKPDEVLDFRLKDVSESKFAALYYPWLKVRDPITKHDLLVPPCGHMAGVWARSDGERGVHKPPANEVVRGVTQLAFHLAQAEQGELNRNGINCIRTFLGRGPVVWGARTLCQSDPEWRYLNVRRLFNYVAESIMQGTQWAVFEPNDDRLWLRLRVATTSFLTRVWRDGGLFGSTPNEAFYVKCDAQTNPPDEVDAGRVTIEVGISPVKPAEFVVFKISQFTAGADEAAA